MAQDEEIMLYPQEEEEAIASIEKCIEAEKTSSSISEDKAEAIAVRLSEIGSVMKTYIELHPDRFQNYLNGEREERPDNPTPIFPTKYGNKRK